MLGEGFRINAKPGVFVGGGEGAQLKRIGQGARIRELGKILTGLLVERKYHFVQHAYRGETCGFGELIGGTLNTGVGCASVYPEIVVGGLAS